MEPPATKEEYEPNSVAAAKQVISSLLLAVKMLSLYPEDHPLYTTALTGLQDHLEDFLEDHEELEVRVEKSRLLFANEVVHKGEAKDGDLAFALFRDGILSLVFQRGWDPWEIRTFVGILDKYKTLPAEADGDVVTALWEAELSHIKYESADNILEADSEDEAFLTEGHNRRLGKLPPKEERAGAESVAASGSDDHSSDSAHEMNALPKIDMTSTLLTHEEIRALVEMTRQEEERDAVREILNIIADLFQGRQDDQLCDVVFDFLKEELHACFARKDFEVSFRILKGLRRIYALCERSEHVARARINELFTTASAPDFFSPLLGLFPTMSARDIEKAREVLLLLPSGAVLGLAPMMTECGGSAPVQEMLSEVIVALAARNTETLVKVLNTAEEDLLRLIVPLLGRLYDHQSAEALVKMTRHKSEKVRVAALKAIVARELWVPEKLRSLMDDESDLVRKLLVEYFGSRQSESAERILLTHLRNQKIRNKDGDHLSPHIEALGLCGSARSVPFLKEVLLSGGWVSRFRGSALREGAAVALSKLGTEEAARVLEQAGRNRYPGIKHAVQAVMKVRGDQGDTK